jgi:hypothetical protein
MEVIKKETLTVAGEGFGWAMMAAAAAAVFTIVAVIAGVAARRRKRLEEPEPSGEGRLSSVPDGDTVALRPVPPAEDGPEGPGEEARAVIDSTVDILAGYQDVHPEEALDVAPVMEKLNIAREMLKSGEYDDALDFARAAEAAVNKMTAPAARRRVAVRKKALAVKSKDGPVVKKEAASMARRCPECGEPLEPGWPVCPACGHRP